MDFYWKKEWTVPVVGAVSFAAGAAVGGLLVRDKYKKAVDDISEVALKAMQDLELESQMKQAASNRVTHLLLRIDDLNGQLEDFRKEGAQLPSSEDLEVRDEPFPTPELLVNIPADPEAPYVWTPEDDAEERAGDGPYILHQDEFFAEQKGYRQLQLEWYVGDKVLCDENQVVIYNPEKVVGQLPWGRGSDDPDTLYIRNDANRAEYQVHRNPGSFTIDVLGLQVEAEADADDIRHSQRIHRFRDSD